MKERIERIPGFLQFMAVWLGVMLVFGGACATVLSIEDNLSKKDKEKWSTSTVLLGRGINLDQEYSLLALRREGDLVTRTGASFSGGFFFLVGGVSGSLKSTTQTEYFIGFVADLAGQPVVLRLPASQFDFQFAQVVQPQVNLLVRESTWGSSYRERDNRLPREEEVERISTTYILEQDLGRAVITLSEEQFHKDIAVLQYSRQSMR